MTPGGGLGVVRAGLAVAGAAAGLFGAYRLLDVGWSNLGAAAPWLLGGEVVHDAVLTPMVLAACAIGSWLLPPSVRGVGATTSIVLGSVTLVAVPVLGRFGAKADNPTLLDRPYAVGWTVLAALVLVARGLRVALRRRRGAAHGG